MRTLQKSITQWLHSFKFGTFFATTLSVFGVVWGLVEASSFFVPSIEELLSDRLIPFVSTIFFALVVAIFRVRPKTKFEYRLNNRNVIIELRVGDIFQVIREYKYHPAMVVPVNNCFENSLSDRVYAPSIQGRLLRDFYSGKPDHLDKDIERAIQTNPSLYVPSAKIETNNGELTGYDIGTVIRVEQDEIIFYLLANTKLHPNGKADKSTRNDISIALPRLWYFISEHGEAGDVAIPVLYSGHGRSNVPYEEIVQEIIKSFVASCAEQSYCRRLIVVCYHKDVSEKNINMKELSDFLEAQCKYSYTSSRNEKPIGTQQKA